VKKLRGTERKSRAPKSEPKPKSKKGIGKSPPAWLSGPGKTEWKRIGPELERLGLLTIADVPQFSRYCDAWAHFVRLSKKLSRGELVTAQGANGYRQQVAEVALQQKYGDIVHKLADRFGLDPSSRASLDVMPGQFQAPTADAKPAEEKPAKGGVLARRMRVVS
jgi:P27 family predicted phage terminase small subunit